MTDAALDDVLCRWHHWLMQKRFARGYSGHSAGMDLYRSSCQYDDLNGALDDDLERRTMRTVDFEVGEIPQPYRARLFVEAARVAHGLPGTPCPITTEARRRLAARLRTAGVLEPA